MSSRPTNSESILNNAIDDVELIAQEQSTDVHDAVHLYICRFKPASWLRAALAMHYMPVRLHKKTG